MDQVILEKEIELLVTLVQNTLLVFPKMLLDSCARECQCISVLIGHPIVWFCITTGIQILK